MLAGECGGSIIRSQCAAAVAAAGALSLLAAGCSAAAVRRPAASRRRSSRRLLRTRPDYRLPLRFDGERRRSDRRRAGQRRLPDRRNPPGARHAGHRADPARSTMDAANTRRPSSQARECAVVAGNMVDEDRGRGTRRRRTGGRPGPDRCAAAVSLWCRERPAPKTHRSPSSSAFRSSRCRPGRQRPVHPRRRCDSSFPMPPGVELDDTSPISASIRGGGTPQGQAAKAKAAAPTKPAARAPAAKPYVAMQRPASLSAIRRKRAAMTARPHQPRIRRSRS